MDYSMFKIRNYVPDDRPYIARSIGNSWLRSKKNKDRSIAALNKKIDFFLEACVVKVVCLAEDDHTIAAFLVVQPVDEVAIIHALFVRGYFRRMGIATELLTRLRKNFSVTVQSMNYCDDDKLLKTAEKLFDAVLDKSHMWTESHK